MEQQETLRSSFMQDGTRIYLIFDADKHKYRLATRWYWLAAFDDVHAACDAFEALELIEAASPRDAAKFLKLETYRVPRCEFGQARNTHRRIMYLVSCVERRLAGLRPQRCGSKGSIERWIPA